jgi:predicted amidohydrolase
MRNNQITIATCQYLAEPLNSIDEWENKQFQFYEEVAFQKPNLLLYPEYGSLELILCNQDIKNQNPLQQVQAIQNLHHKFISTFEKLASISNCNIVTPSFPIIENNILSNRSYWVNPYKGVEGYQDKLIPTPYERSNLRLDYKNKKMQLFEINNIKFGIQICYDSEFPYLIYDSAHNGMEILLIPSCTDAVSGLHRVNIGAQARALENQIYTVVSSITCYSDWCDIITGSGGYCGCYATPDLGFPPNGIIGKKEINEIGWLVVNLNTTLLQNVRKLGSVTNYQDSATFF